jgi:two-component system, sensor histidine kinase PdtaS
VNREVVKRKVFLIPANKEIFIKRIFKLLCGGVSNLIDRNKKVNNFVKDYTSNEHKEFEETVKNALKLHDMLLKMGFKEIAEAALKIHNDLLRIKERKAQPDLGEHTSVYLRDEKGHIYGKLGVRTEVSQKELSKNEPARSELTKEDVQKNVENYRLFLQNIRGSIGLWLDDNFFPTFIDGAVQEITGYSKEYFLSKNLRWIELVIPEDLPLVLKHIEWVKAHLNTYEEAEYRIRRKDGEIRWLRDIIHVLPEGQKSLGVFQSFVRDINEQKKAEESRVKLEEVHIKEIHHRVKNNLQLISSLLDLQAENIAGQADCDTSKVSEAFKESRDRIASMALIYEELYKSTDTVSIDFSEHTRELVSYLFDSNKGINDNISMKLNVEQIHLNMDIAVPLGNIATELISNALKHAFSDRQKGVIDILLCKRENYEKDLEKSEGIRTDSECQKIKDLEFVLVVRDNGIGFPKEIDFKRTDSLGLQIVNTLVEEINGCIELNRNEGTVFTIWFSNKET